MRPWSLAVLLLLPLVQAQPGPDVAVLVYHPFPDDADPLGIDAGGRDPFIQRHGRFDAQADGFDFPGFVADGVVFIEGLPAAQSGEDPLQATRRAYDAAVATRIDRTAPLSLEVLTTIMDGMLRTVVRPQPSADLSGDDLRVWYAIVEDPVHYRPPAALSNGVFDHPFVVRAVTTLGPVAAEHRASWNATGADADRLWVAVWVQQAASHGSHYEPGEVVQTAFHPVARDRTLQVEKAVLVEAYSATWCAPCLFGDRALEALAADHGVPREAVQRPSAGIFQAPAAWTWGVIALAAVLGATVRLPRGPR